MAHLRDPSAKHSNTVTWNNGDAWDKIFANNLFASSCPGVNRTSAPLESGEWQVVGGSSLATGHSPLSLVKQARPCVPHKEKLSTLLDDCPLWARTTVETHFHAR